MGCKPAQRATSLSQDETTELLLGGWVVGRAMDPSADELLERAAERANNRPVIGTTDKER